MSPHVFVAEWRKRLGQRMPDELRKRLNRLCFDELFALFPQRGALEHVQVIADADTTADAAIRVATRRGLRQLTDEENSANAANDLWGKF